ncbi:MAG: iron ABC transporter permease [Anaerolineales bacterium]|nr:iron ABC transporter permease [Anaerolineales bacterium]
MFSPLIVLAQESIRPVWLNREELLLALPVGRRLALLAQSLGLATSVALAGMLLGILAATALWRWGQGRLGQLRWLLLALAPLPPYIHALAWSSTVEAWNTLLRGAGLPTLPLQGWPGSWWVQVMSLAPVAVALALVGFGAVDPQMVEASLMLRDTSHTLRKVVLPLASPMLVASGGFLFLLSLVDYSVPSLFQKNVYALEIFAEYSASNLSYRAFLIALPLLAITMAVVLASQAGLRGTTQSRGWVGQAWQRRLQWPIWLTILQSLALGILGLQVIVPLVSLVKETGGLSQFTQSLAAAHSEIVFSLVVACVAAILCLPLGVALARQLKQAGSRSWLAWLLVTGPLAIPGPLVGIGLIAIWNRPWLEGIYASAAMPVLAALARTMPLAIIILYAQLRRIDPLLMDAARMFAVRPVRRWLQIYLPLLAPGMLAAAGFVFALTLGELGATLIVVPPGQSTITLRIYNYLHYGASETVAGLCLAMVITALASGGLAALALAGWSHLSGGGASAEGDRA